MFFWLANNRNPNSWAAKMRRKRARLFTNLLTAFPEPVRILDVGGTLAFWKLNAVELPKLCDITIINLTEIPSEGLPHIRSVVGDARRMAMFADESFDVAFSNSVIEHVGTLYDQMAMASEVQRVAKAYFVQTPYRYFPLEPHFLFPFWQFLPIWCRARMLQRSKVGWMPRQPGFVRAKAEVEQVRLLDAKEITVLFPHAKIERERIGPLTKSLIAIKKPLHKYGRSDG